MANELKDPVTGEPLVYSPEEQWIVDEFTSLGLTPTQADIENWSEYGTPGQITAELGSGFEEIELSSGVKVKSYSAEAINAAKEASGLGDEFLFNYSNKEGQAFRVPAGTPVAPGMNYKKVQTEGGFDYYVNEGEASGGVFGGLADLTGINEFEEAGKELGEAIPNELKSGLVPIPLISDPFGITQGFWGGEYAQEGRASASDLTGLSEDEIMLGQDIGLEVMGAIAGIATGNPYVTAGVRSLKSASKTGEGMKDTEDLLKDVGINFAVAGAIDMTARLLTPSPTPAPVGEQSATAMDAESIQGMYDTGGKDLFLGPDVSSAGEVIPGGALDVAKVSPSYIDPFALSTPAELAVAPLGAGAASTAGGVVGGTTAGAGAAVPSASGMDWRAWATIGSLGLGAAGLGLQAYGILSDDEEDQIDEQKDAQMELQAQQFEYEQKLLEMKIEAEKELMEMEKEPIPSKAAPSVYKPGTVKSGKPYGVK